MSYGNMTFQFVLTAIDQTGSAFQSVGANVSAVTEKSKDLDKAQQNTTFSAKNLAVGLSSVATAGFSLYMSYESIVKSQIMLDRSNVMLQRSTEAVKTAQDNYNDAVAKYGANSSQAQDAATKLGIAQDALTVSQERADQAQQNVNNAMMYMAVSVLPAIVTGVSGAVKVFEQLGGSVSKLSSDLSSFGIGPIGIAIGAVATGIYALWNGLNETAAAQKAFDDMIQRGKDAMDKYTSSVSINASTLEEWGNQVAIDRDILNDLTNSLSEQEAALNKDTDAMAKMFAAGYERSLQGQFYIRQLQAEIDTLQGNIATTNDAKKATEDKTAIDVLAADAAQRLADGVKGLEEKYGEFAAASSKYLPIVKKEFDLAINRKDYEDAERIVEDFADQYGASTQYITKLLQEFKVEQTESSKYIESRFGELEKLATKAIAIYTENQQKAADAQAKIFADQQATLQKQADSLNLFYTDKFVAPTQKYKDSLAATAADVDRILSTQNGNTLAQLAISIGMVQKFADEWGLTWQEADTIITGAVGQIETEAAKVPKTIEEQLVGKAQDDLKAFQDCASGKFAGISAFGTEQMDKLVSDTNDLLSKGLVGQAQDNIKAFQACSTNKAADLAASIKDSMDAMVKAGINSAADMEKYGTLKGWYDTIMAQIGGVSAATTTNPLLNYRPPDLSKEIGFENAPVWTTEQYAKASAYIYTDPAKAWFYTVQAAQELAATVGKMAKAGSPVSLQEGGIVTRPTFALIGEHGSEAVTPLSRGGLGNNLTVNFNVTGALDRATADYAAHQIEESLKNVLVEPSSSNAGSTHKRIRFGNKVK